MTTRSKVVYIGRGSSQGYEDHLYNITRRPSTQVRFVGKVVRRKEHRIKVKSSGRYVR